MNNKGFMMAEVVVVSAIILVFMTGMYVSYNKLFTIYNQRVDYYDVTTLYKLGYYRDTLKDKGTLTFPTDRNIPTIIESEDINDGDVVYIVYNSMGNLSSVVGHEKFNNINPTFKDYISFLSDSVDLTNTEYVMIMESCDTSDENNCKYAYLEVKND